VEQPTGPCWRPAHRRCRRRRGAKLLRCGFCGSVSGPFVEADWLFRVCMCTACQAGPAAMLSNATGPRAPTGPRTTSRLPGPRTAWSTWVARPRRARSWRSTARAQPQLTLRPPRPVSAAHRPGTSGQERSRPVQDLPPDRRALRDRLLPPLPIRSKRGQCRRSCWSSVLDDTADGAPTPWSTPTAPAVTVSAHSAASCAGGSVAIGRQPSACSARSARAAARSIRSAVSPGEHRSDGVSSPATSAAAAGWGSPLPSQVAQPPPGLRLRTPHRAPPLPAS
jgi:hypothetical protein